MKISLCIPVYNEEKIISETMETVSAYMEKKYGDGYEIIYINDGSTDGTLKKLNEAKDPHIRVVTYEKNRGKGYAVRQGMLCAQGELVLFTDCDLAYGTDVIGAFCDALSEHPETDLLIGSRALHPEGYEGYSFSRKLISKIYRRILSVYGGLHLSDSQSGIKGFRKEMAKRVFSVSEVDRFAFDLEAILLTRYFGGKIEEHPVKIVSNRPSTISFFKDSVKMLGDVRNIKKRIKSMKKETAK